MTEEQVILSYGIGETPDGKFVIVWNGQGVGFLTSARTLRKVLLGLLMSLETQAEKAAERIIVPGRRTDG